MMNHLSAGNFFQASNNFTALVVFHRLRIGNYRINHPIQHHWRQRLPVHHIDLTALCWDNKLPLLASPSQLSIHTMLQNLQVKQP